MNKYEKRMMEHGRLAILRTLKDAPGYQSNDSIIYETLNALGIKIGRDQVKSQVQWLADQDCLTLEELGNLKVATLTQQGLDVAQGNIRRDGIQAPGPGS